MPITRETVWRFINICLNLFLAKHLDIFLVSVNELLCNLQQTISSRARLGDGWGPVGAGELGFPPPTPAHSGTCTCTWNTCQATLRRAGIQFRGCAISDEPCHLSESVSTTVMVITESWTTRRAEHRRNNWCFWTVVLEETLESPVASREMKPGYSLEGLMLKLKLHYLATWCEELTHWKRPWCWERLRAREEGGDRGWDGWMASLIQ